MVLYNLCSHHRFYNNCDKTTTNSAARVWFRFHPGICNVCGFFSSCLVSSQASSAIKPRQQSSLQTFKRNIEPSNFLRGAKLSSGQLLKCVQFHWNLNDFRDRASDRKRLLPSTATSMLHHFHSSKKFSSKNCLCVSFGSVSLSRNRPGRPQGAASSTGNTTGNHG